MNISKLFPFRTLRDRLFWAKLLFRHLPTLSSKLSSTTSDLVQKKPVSSGDALEAVYLQLDACCQDLLLEIEAATAPSLVFKSGQLD